MHKHEALLFTVFLRVYRFYIDFVTNYSLGAITFDVLIDLCFFIMRFWLERKAVMITLAVRRVVSDQAGNPGICSVFVRFTFIRWFRDPLPPGTIT